MAANSAPTAAEPARRFPRVLVASGIALTIVIASVVYRLAVSATAETYRETTVLVDDNRKRCEEIASDVLGIWESAAANPPCRSSAIRRMQVAQAQEDDLTLVVTQDRHLEPYDVLILWA